MHSDTATGPTSGISDYNARFPQTFRGSNRHQRETTTAPPRVGAVLSLRWKWLAAGAVLGAVLGLLAGTFGGGQYKAVGTIEVRPSSPDSTSTTQAAQAVAQTGKSAAVLSAAAQKRGVSASDLAKRVTVRWVDGTGMVEISAQATGATSASADTNAVGEAIIAAGQTRSTTRLTTIRDRGNEVIANEPLLDPIAEDSRKSALGAALADQQGAALVAGTNVDFIDPATEGERVNLPLPVSLGLGLVGGVLLGALLALAIPIGRHKLASNRELLVLAPDLAHRSSRAAAEQAGRLVSERASGVVLLAMPGAERAAQQMSEQVARAVASRGLPVNIVNVTKPDDLTILNRSGLAGEPIQVVVTGVDQETLSSVAGQSTVRSAVVAAPRASTLRDIAEVTSAVATTSPRVVIA